MSEIDTQAATVAGQSPDETPRPSGAPIDVAKSPRTFGDYEFIHEIARGGMGVVYRARQRSLGRLVALKMILTGQWASEVEVQRFRTEAEAAARLTHPNIVPIYEYGERDGLHYFSMKLIEGAPLSDRILEFSSDPRRAVALLVPVCRAVHHAHQRGILHRDLKPANILLDKDDVPYITDFGLAKPLDVEDSERGPTRTGAIVGTLAYMAPEQASGQKDRLTTAADIYSLGAMLYELVAGRPPFRGATPMGTLRQVMECEPESPRHISRSVDRDLATICLKCLEKAPGRRYGSAEALADDLERWLRHEPIQARPLSTADQLLKWCRRRPQVALLVVVTILVAASTLGRELRNRRVLAESLQRSQRYLYAADMNLAEQALSARKVARTQELLRRHGPGTEADLRGFEWYYLRAQCERDYVLVGHEGPVRAVAFSPDGRTLVSGGGDGLVKLWDVRSGRVLRTLDEHQGPVRSVVYSGDGRTLAIGSLGGGVQLWDLTTSAPPVAVGRGKESVRALALSQDGRRLVLGSDTDESTRVWDEAPDRLGGRWSATFTVPVEQSPSGERQRVRSVALSPDGKRLATSWTDGVVRLWDVAAGRELRALPAHGSGGGVAMHFSADGQSLFTADFIVPAEARRAIVEWDVASGTERRRIPGVESRVFALALSPDGGRLAVGMESGSVRQWDLRGEAPTDLPLLNGHPASVWTLAFSPDGKLLASGSGDSTVRLWDTATGQPVQNPAGLKEAELPLPGHHGWVMALAFSPDGGTLVTGDEKGVVRLWDGRSATLRRALSREYVGQIYGAAFSPDGRVLATASGDHTATLWDPASGEVRQVLRGHEGELRSVAFSPDGKLIATASEDGTARLWGAADGQQKAVLRGYGNVVYSVAFSPDGQRVVTGSHDGTLRFWTVPEGREERSLWNHGGAVSAMAFTPSGDVLVSVGWDWLGMLWDLRRGEQRAKLKGHDDRVFALALGADRSGAMTLVTAGQDSAVKLWDLETGQERVSLPSSVGAVRAVALSPDGQSLVLGAHGSARLWRAPRDR